MTRGETPPPRAIQVGTGTANLENVFEHSQRNHRYDHSDKEEHRVVDMTFENK